MKVVPAGVQIGGLPVGGLTSEQARNAISWWYNRPLRFVFYGKHWTVRPSVFAASVDSDWAVQRVLRARPNEHLELRTEADSDAIQRYVRALDGRLAVEPVDATASLKGLRPVVEPGKPGLELNRVKTAQRIETLLAIARRPQSVHPVARTVAPSVTANGFGAVVVIYRGSNELHLYKGSKPWRTFGVATGQAIYPTPTGSWHVVDKQRAGIMQPVIRGQRFRKQPAADDLLAGERDHQRVLDVVIERVRIADALQDKAGRAAYVGRILRIAMREILEIEVRQIVAEPVGHDGCRIEHDNRSQPL